MATTTAVSYDDVVAWVRAFAAVVVEHKDELTALDSAIGDADHGINMNRGMQAAVVRLDELAAAGGGGDAGPDIGGLLKSVGMTLVSKVGGAGGPLYGTLFLQLGQATAGKSELSLGDWAAALDAGVKGVQARGKAEPDDKTMVDALLPAAAALRQALDDGASLAEALRRSEAAAGEGMTATIPLVARKGRASYLGERSAGHQDPGATSSWLLVKTAADTWANRAEMD
ncbi:MAG: dihydroxyacetone kinase subunit DhaL [Acidimicrobiales bacterium]